MNTFINLSSKQSKGIDQAIYKNAKQLKKDALLIAEKNKSYSSATSLLILSSEEVIKAILVLLHSEGYKVYQISDAKKFFYNHEIRHQLAQLLELTAGFIESVHKYKNKEPVKLFKTNNNVFGGFLNFVHEIATASDPFVDSTKRIKDLENFNDNKNSGFYVGYKDKLIIPHEEITETDYRKTKEVVERIFRVYKILRILYHPNIYNRKDKQEIENIKNQMKVFIDEGMVGFSFKEFKLL